MMKPLREKLRRKETLHLLRNYGVASILAIAAAIFIRTYFLEAYRVPTSVMSPTLESGDLIFVSKSAYRGFFSHKKVEYGDVVVFTDPDQPKTQFIKRVLGKERDLVSIQNGFIFLNGKKLDFTPIKSQTCGQEAHPAKTYSVCMSPPLLENLSEMTVPEHSVFLIGDLRSKDSSKKEWAVVSEDQILGKAVWVWLSIYPRAERPGTSLFSLLRTERVFTKIH